MTPHDAEAMIERKLEAFARELDALIAEHMHKLVEHVGDRASEPFVVAELEAQRRRAGEIRRRKMAEAEARMRREAGLLN